MKKVAVLAISALCLVSFNAFAGGNCLYGPDGKHIDASAPVVEDELTDPRLLALLKKEQSEGEELVAPIIHN